MSSPPAADATVTIAKLLIVGGVVGAVTLPAVSWVAGLMCAVIAALGWMVLVRRRPTSRWARGWTAFRHKK